MLWNSITGYLESWFNHTGVAGNLILLSAGLALVFGIIFLVYYWPPLLRKPGLWLTAVGSALLTVVATAFIYVTISYYYTQWLDATFSTGTLNDTMLLWSIPIVLALGLVQEGAKMVPMLFWWLGKTKPDPRMGVIIGAVAGAGYGIFEAFYSHNQIFATGWGWDNVALGGVTSLLPFWICFWTVACHIGISALVGYGLAKRKIWLYYPLAAFVHALVTYLSVLAAKGTITGNQMGIILAVGGLIIIGISLWLHRRKYEEAEPVAETEIAPSTLPDEVTPLTALPEQEILVPPKPATLSSLKPAIMPPLVHEVSIPVRQEVSVSANQVVSLPLKPETLPLPEEEEEILVLHKRDKPPLLEKIPAPPKQESPALIVQVIPPPSEAKIPVPFEQKPLPPVRQEIPLPPRQENLPPVPPAKGVPPPPPKTLWY